MVRKQVVMMLSAMWFCQNPQGEKSTPCSVKKASPVQLHTGVQHGFKSSNNYEDNQTFYLRNLTKNVTNTITDLFILKTYTDYNKAK